MRDLARTSVRGLVGTALLAVMCNLALELARLLTVDGLPWRFKTPAFPLLFVLGTLLVWAVVGLVHALVGRLWITTAVMTTLTALLAIADHLKVRFRNEPIYPDDRAFLGDIGFLRHVAGPGPLAFAVLTLLVLVGASVLVVRRFDRPPRERPSWPLRAGARVTAGVVSLLVLATALQFNQPGNLVRAAYDVLGADWRPWSQQRNYLGNGFVAGVLYNLDVPPIPAPAGYDRATMARVVDRYQGLADRINAHRDADALDNVNVVMVLSESFSDPTRLSGIALDRDPLARTHAAMDRTLSGEMLAQSVGGGTANMEFEALTGMSMSLLPPQVRVPYQMLVPEHASFPSVVRWMRTLGHRAIAVHPFSTEMYRRPEVYRAFGIEQFVHEGTMAREGRIGHDAYISDASAYDEVVRRISDSSRPLFVNLVTMQNHMPYEDRYDDPVPVRAPDGSTAGLGPAGQYVRGLTHTDRANAALLDELGRLDEDTVVIMYGDHLPGVYPDRVRAANTPARLHRTPYLIWSSTGNRPEAGPLTSPTHFVDLALQKLDAAVPPYYALLQRLRRVAPATEHGTWFGPDGSRIAPARLTRDEAEVLRDYRLVQYDLAAGQRWSAQAMFAAASGDRVVRASSR